MKKPPIENLFRWFNYNVVLPINDEASIKKQNGINDPYIGKENASLVNAQHVCPGTLSKKDQQKDRIHRLVNVEIMSSKGRGANAYMYMICSKEKYRHQIAFANDEVIINSLLL